MVDGRPAWLKAVQPFVGGGAAACLATIATQPIDMIKVRIQVAGEIPGAPTNPLTVAYKLIKHEGPLALYKGQLTYSTARLGLFRVVSDLIKTEKEPALPLYKKAMVGLAAGGIASLIGTPADLSLIRLQADATLPVAARRNYTGALNALFRIAKEEGLCTWWRGATPTIARAMALNMGMLASFDQSKEMLEKHFAPSLYTTLTASAIAGWFAVTFSLPFDFVKTRMQRMKADSITGKMPYSSMMDCAMKTIRQKGVFGLYTGYFTYYLRIAPHAMITLVALDYMNKSVMKFYEKDS